MNKALILKRLQDTIDRLKSLEPENFDYTSYVTRSEGACGTVCCVVGWYPKWFPEANFEWRIIAGGLGFILDLSSKTKNIRSTLEDWHGIDSIIIDALFYGQELYIPGEAGLPDDPRASLSDVIKRFEMVLKHLTRSL